MMARLRNFLALIAALVLFSGAAPAMAQQSGHVYLLRGLANVFSYGMDDLATKLNQRGIAATVHEYGQWESLASTAAAESRANRNAPIIIVGHSLGADAAIEMGERLTALGVPARLVITFDPVGVTQVSNARGRFVNYYQDNNGFGKRLTAGPGFKGQLVNRNLDSDTSIDHFNIEKSARLHSEVISSVQSVTARPKPKPKPVAPATPAAPAAPSPASADTAAKPVQTPAATPTAGGPAATAEVSAAKPM